MEKIIIYKITNLINNKIYIGQTTQTLRKRWYRHCWESKNRCRLPIQKVIKKYGKENFTIEVIDSASYKSESNTKERCWIQEFNTNINKGGVMVIILQMVVKVI